MFLTTRCEGLTAWGGQEPGFILSDQGVFPPFKKKEQTKIPSAIFSFLK